MNTGRRIKELRTQKGLTQTELADVTARTIQRIEASEVHPRASMLRMMAQALDTDLSQFLEPATQHLGDLPYRTLDLLAGAATHSTPGRIIGRGGQCLTPSLSCWTNRLSTPSSTSAIHRHTFLKLVSFMA